MPTRPPTHQPHGSRQARERTRKRDLDRRRGSSAARLYDRQWRKARAAHLAAHPLCVECLKSGDITPATVVDHVTPHRGDLVLFWDPHNRQSLCESHHNAKTAREMATEGRGA